MIFDSKQLILGLIAAAGLACVVPSQAKSQQQLPLGLPSASEHKSPALAVLLSLAVPGLGEAYVGRFDAGRYLTASEVALWGGYAGLSVYTADFQTDMENDAIANASASPDRRGDQNYFAHVGQYQSSDLFNDEMLREGQPSELIPSAQSWRWSTKQDLQNFNALRIRVQTLDNDRVFVLAAIVVNHLISAIDAYIVAKKFNKLGVAGMTGETQIEIGGHMGALFDPHGASLSARLTF